MSARPSGTVTFLFTDVVGSTALWDARPNDMRAALSSHDAIVRNMVDEFDGYVFSTAGDSFAVAFGRPLQAAYAALGIRSRLEGADWAGPFRLEVRFGLHTGTADERDGDYFGPHLNRAARLMSAGHGGQVVVSSVTAELLRGETGGEFALADLGEHYLRDVSTPTYAFQLDSLGELRRFPPLRSVESAGGNLPIQPSRFFGRGDEITEIVKRLGSGERLVTLAGHRRGR